MREYIPLYGPKGIVVKIYDDHLWIGGSNAWYHWLHHVIPGAKRREIDCGIEVADLALELDITDIRGLSVGGCIAQIAAMIIGGRCTTYGTKRAPAGYEVAGTHYRHRGDIVPFLPPWRPRIACTTIGVWRPLWVAHNPKSYREVLHG